MQSQKPEEEEYIEETDKDFQSDNKSVAEVGFIATEGTVKNKQVLASVIDGVNHPSFTRNIMFGDSGSSCHIRNTMEDMFDIEAINEQIGDVGINIRTTRKGKLRADIVQVDGSKKIKILVQSSTPRTQKKICRLLQQKCLEVLNYQATQTITYS